MSCDRRGFMKTGLAGAVSLATACGSDSAPAATADTQRESAGVAPAAAAASSGWPTVEFWMKGLFAYLPQADTGPDGNWIAQPAHAQGGHTFTFFIERRLVATALGAPNWRENGDYYEWVGSIDIRGVSFGPDASGVSPNVPDTPQGDLCPVPPLNDQANWNNRRFIPRLSALDATLVRRDDWLSDNYSHFALLVPSGGMWYPRAPRRSAHRRWKWRYEAINPANGNPMGNPLPYRQSITDTVAFKADFRAGGSRTLFLLRELPGENGQPRNPSHIIATLPLVNRRITGHVWLVSSPTAPPMRDYPQENKGLVDFLALYNLCTQPRTIAPVRLPDAEECPGDDSPDDPRPAGADMKFVPFSGGDVFCAGGEIPGP